MIDIDTYNILKQFAEKKNLSNIELAEVIRVFCGDFKKMYESPDNKSSKKIISKLLVAESNLNSLLILAKSNVQENAENLTLKTVRKISIIEAIKSIGLNIISNFLFIILSVLIYFVIQDVAVDFLGKFNSSENIIAPADGSNMLDEEANTEPNLE